MQGAPPPRYRVVERGRRLEVIDTWRARRPEPPARLVERVRVPARGPARAGLAPFTTHALYDAKGPRTLMVDAQLRSNLEAAGVAALVAGVVIVAIGLFWWPLLAALAFGVLNPRLRARVRKAVADWLDGIDESAAAERV